MRPRLPLEMQYVDLIERTSRKDGYDDHETIASLLSIQAEAENRLDLHEPSKALIRRVVLERIEAIKGGSRSR